MHRVRVHRTILIGSTLLGCWLGMQAIHESGHVLGAWLTGGRVERVVLHPLTISRTDVAENRDPLVVVWLGPVIGVVVPLLLWAAAVAARRSWAFVPRFFAGFCLIANGLYLGLGSFGRVGDCGEMIRHGSPPWHLWLFGLISAPAGLLLWHGLGPRFGIGPAPRKIDAGAAFGTLAVCLILLAIACRVGGE